MAQLLQHSAHFHSFLLWKRTVRKPSQPLDEQENVCVNGMEDSNEKSHDSSQ